MLTDELMEKSIRRANRRVVYISPGIWLPVAESLIEYKENNTEAALEIILDSDPQIFRLGYGNYEAIVALKNANIAIRKCSGIRVGLLITDEKAWFFTPTPRLVEEELSSRSEFSPNSIFVSTKQADELLYSIAPHLIIDDRVEQEVASEKPPIVKVPISEIANEIFDTRDIEEIEKNLEKSPPQQFDLARQVNVYSSYIQFVELNLEGTHLSRHTITIPKELINLASDENDQDRLKASYQLLEPGGKASGKEMQDKMRKIRSNYIKSLGNGYGNVILKQCKNKFIKEIEELEKELEEYKGTVKDNLIKDFNLCKDRLINILSPIVKENPPEDLKNFTLDITDEVLQKYLNEKLDKIIPDVEDFVSDMAIKYQFKDVTYETLHDKEFIEKLKKALPYTDFPEIPINEYTAAKSK